MGTFSVVWCEGFDRDTCLVVPTKITQRLVFPILIKYSTVRFS